MPNLSDGQFVTNQFFQNIKVGEMHINNITFSNRVMIQVDQMSLSKNAFEFYSLLRQQKESTNSLFQPSFGKIKGNVHAVNSGDQPAGLFWATDVRTKVVFLDRINVPYNVPHMDPDFNACTHLRNSSTTIPPFWQ